MEEDGSDSENNHETEKSVQTIRTGLQTNSGNKE